MSSEHPNRSLRMCIRGTMAPQYPILRNIGHRIENWVRGISQFLYNTKISKILGILENIGLKGASLFSNNNELV